MLAVVAEVSQWAVPQSLQKLAPPVQHDCPLCFCSSHWSLREFREAPQASWEAGSDSISAAACLFAIWNTSQWEEEQGWHWREELQRGLGILLSVVVDAEVVKGRRMAEQGRPHWDTVEQWKYLQIWSFVFVILWIRFSFLDPFCISIGWNEICWASSPIFPPAKIIFLLAKIIFSPA